jgi:hypothetical protein
VDTASERLAAPPDTRNVSTPTFNEIRRGGGLVTVEWGSAQAIQTMATGAPEIFPPPRPGQVETGVIVGRTSAMRLSRVSWNFAVAVPRLTPALR